MPAILIPQQFSIYRERRFFRETAKWQLGDVAYQLAFDSVAGKTLGDRHDKAMALLMKLTLETSEPYRGDT